MKVSKIMIVAASLAVSVLLAQQVQAAELWAGRAAPGDVGKLDPTGPTGTSLAGGGPFINAMAYDAASDTLWGTKGGSSSTDLHVINQSDGSITSTVVIGNDWVTALAWDFDTNTLWGNDTGSSIIEINPANGAVSGTVAVQGDNINGLAYGKGTLWGFDETGPVFAINTSTGNTTPLVDLPVGASGTGLAYDPDTDRLYASTSNTPSLIFEVNPNNGTFNALGPIAAGGFGRIDALAPTTVIPEPASLALLGLGGLMMLRRRRA